VDLALSKLSVFQDILNRCDTLSKQIIANLFKLGAGNLQLEILTIGKGLTLDIGGVGSRENALGLLALGSQTASGTGIVLDVNAASLLELIHAELDKAIVEVLTTQVGVTIGSLDLEDTVIDGQEGNVESSTTQVENQNVALTSSLFVKAISNSGGSWLVNDSLNIQTGNGTSVFSCLSLGIIKVSRHSDNCILNLLTKVSISDLLHLGKDHGGNFFGLEFLVLTLEIDNDSWFVVGAGFNLERPELDVLLDEFVGELAANQTLSVEDGVLGVSRGLVLGGVTNKAFTISESNVRGSSVASLVVGDDFNSFVLPDTDTRVCGAQIDSDC